LADGIEAWQMLARERLADDDDPGRSGRVFRRQTTTSENGQPECREDVRRHDSHAGAVVGHVFASLDLEIALPFPL
jgi:hypothetical protein